MEAVLFLLLTGTLLDANPTEVSTCRAQLAVFSASVRKGSPFPGTENAPEALLKLGLLEGLRAKGGAIKRRESFQDASDEMISRLEFDNPSMLPRLRRLHGFVFASRNAGLKPITLGGDHSVAIGSASGSRRASKVQGKRLGLIWFDAHTDLYFKKWTKNNLHAMAMSQLTGDGNDHVARVTGRDGVFAPQDVIFVGVRDEGYFNHDNFRERGFHLLSSADIDRLGIESSRRKLEDAMSNFDELHLSFDIDVTNIFEFNAYNFLMENGPFKQDVLQLVDSIANTGKIVSADFVEYVPGRDRDAQTGLFINDVIKRSMTAP